mmetsp:Transcript_33550/g.58754  ORF Transcript_33550/g.58754 Transcript_33550/m.58754 type:complete len:192 (+) Transcript_33550:230-805(+)
MHEAGTPSPTISRVMKLPEMEVLSMLAFDDSLYVSPSCQYDLDCKTGEIGRLSLRNGDEYLGEIKRGKPHGKGTMKYRRSNTHMYIGDWVQGLKEGYGVYVWKDGDKYEGEWKKDLRHGRGSQIWDDGRSYVGEWRYHQVHGEGVAVEADGSTYSGRWKNGHKTGIFIYTKAEQTEAQLWKRGIYIRCLSL